MSTSLNAECHHMLNGISAYLEGELERAECDAIEAHCQTCSRCAGVVEGLRETIGLCRQAGHLPLPDAVRDRARASVRQLLDDGKDE